MVSIIAGGINNMAGWWMPWRQLEALRRIEKGDCMLYSPGGGGIFWWLGGGGCTPQGRALYRKGLIVPESNMARITPTGRNELQYHKALTKEHYEK